VVVGAEVVGLAADVDELDDEDDEHATSASGTAAASTSRRK
jgi:hypothetical protein